MRELGISSGGTSNICRVRGQPGISTGVKQLLKIWSSSKGDMAIFCNKPLKLFYFLALLADSISNSALSCCLFFSEDIAVSFLLNDALTSFLLFLVSPNSLTENPAIRKIHV